jgi:glucose-1-phosphate cytidylyltransferase
LIILTQMIQHGNKSLLKDIAIKGELMAYEHKDFWQPMDTLREKNLLEELWESGKAPWKTW